MDTYYFMWWFAEIDQNRVTVLVNDVEELSYFRIK